jgi:hypothetical protein
MGEIMTGLILIVIGLPMFVVASQSDKFVEWVNKLQD